MTGAAGRTKNHHCPEHIPVKALNGEANEMRGGIVNDRSDCCLPQAVLLQNFFDLLPGIRDGIEMALAWIGPSAPRDLRADR